MPDSKHQRMKDLVPHPRYGVTIVPSGLTLSDAELRRRYGSRRDDVVFPESAIRADPTRQNFTVFPRNFYVDTLRDCRSCGRPFLFFAREQKYWYEVLRFYVDADCVHCPECRRSNQQLQRRFRRYSEQISKSELPESELATLVEDAVFLWNAGILKNEQRLRQLRNLARRRLPGRAATNSIDRLISELKH